MKIPRRSQQGFTFIELVIILAILGVLAAIAIPNYITYKQRKHDEEARQYALSFYDAAISVASDPDFTDEKLTIDARQGTAAAVSALNALNPTGEPIINDDSLVQLDGVLQVDSKTKSVDSTLTASHPDSKNVFELDGQRNVTPKK